VAIGVLAQGGTQQQAADAAHVHRQTICRWLQAPDFRRQLAEIRRAGLEQAACLLAAQARFAAAKLAEVCHMPIGDEDAPASVQVRAAAMILAIAARVQDMMDLEARVELLEEEARHDRSRAG